MRGVILTQPPGVAGYTRAVLTANQTTTTLFSSGTDATNLILAAAANKTYLLRGFFTGQLLRLQVNIPSGASAIGRTMAKLATGTTVRSTADLSPNTPSGGVFASLSASEAELWMVIVTGATAGNVALRIASSSGATATLSRGSALQLRELVQV